MLTDKWLEAQKEDREIISVGYINLNSFVWDQDYQQKSLYEKSRHNMYSTLQTKNLDQGHIQINHDRTMESEIHTSKPACLDIAFSTHPNKIKSYTTHYPIFSDHAMVKLNRSSLRMENQKN